MNNATLLWIDLEMTGLEPDHDRIVELAAIITDWEFNEVASLEIVVKQDQDLLDSMPSEVQKMHNASGLINKIPHGVSEVKAEKELLAFLAKYFDKSPILLAGNSIHQDRRFIRRYWPTVEKRLHYRMLDVSSWKVVFMQKYGVKVAKRNAHRALDDIRGSIEEMQAYLKYVHPDEKTFDTISNKE